MFILFYCLFRASLPAYGGSQARGLIGATVASLHHSHKGTRAESDLHHSSWQCRILNLLFEARDRTCNLMVPSQISFCCAAVGTPYVYFKSSESAATPAGSVLLSYFTCALLVQE